MSDDKNFKRVVAIGDKHCGHRSGLTPPKYQNQICGKKYYYIQAELWEQYEGLVNELKPVHLLIVNADCIDGRGEKSGGVELIARSRMKQVEMASVCIDVWSANHILMTRGTGYHTGYKEDWEDIIATNVNADKIGEHEWATINGITFDIKHKVSGTSIPHGRGTAIQRAKLWNKLWAERELQPKADILLRSHVHFFHGSIDADGLCLYLPALQGMGSKFGARECEQLVDWGLVYFDIYEDGTYDWEPRLLRAESEKAKSIEF